MTRRRAAAWIALACVVPRLAVVLYERGDTLARFTEKSDDFARAFVATGVFGMVPGVPSAYTQPLYGWFLIPLYWIFGRAWLAVGIAQIVVALATALLVYELGRRYVSPRAGLLAALISTLNPYLVWHDVHVNREILDQVVGAALLLAVLLAAERRSLELCVAAGALAGLAILGNTRLTALPLALAVYLLVRHVPALAVGAFLVAAVLMLVPWVVRNRVSVGCFALTTDGRALWKANNAQTYSLLTHGKWIDDVRRIPHSEYNPEEALALYHQTGRVYRPNECAQMRFYQHLVWQFWRKHPGEKAKLTQLGVRMLWDPRTTKTVGRNAGGGLDRAREIVQPLYTVPLFLLAALGLFLVRRPVAALFAIVLGYQTLAAMLFVGATRYRVPTDFVLALLAAAALTRWKPLRE